MDRRMDRCVREEAERLHAQARELLRVHTGALAEIWRVFPRQAEAFAFWDANAGIPDLGCFSEELSATGVRRFLIATRQEFCGRYLSPAGPAGGPKRPGAASAPPAAPPPSRHWYEIIRQGRPCHVYLDLEFVPDANPGVDGEALVARVISAVRGGLQERYNIAVPDDAIVELDSSTPAKFSRHLVVRCASAAFRNNAHVGAFLQWALSAERAQGGAGDGASAPAGEGAAPASPANVEGPQARGAPAMDAGLMVWSKGGVEGGVRTSFVDMGVYTRNRAFRLYLSSKFGKQAVLRETGRFFTKPPRPLQRDTLEKTLVTLTDEEARSFRLLEAFDEERGGDAIPGAAGRRGEGSVATGHIGPPQHGGTSSSPFPAVDDFIRSVCNHDGVQGEIRSWMFLPEAGLLVLQIRANRWCGNVGRAHRSNGVYYCCDLRAGIWYQRCHDPDCRAYRSPAAPLPAPLAWSPPGADQEQAASPQWGTCGRPGPGALEAAGWTEEAALQALDL
ncbi:unnamed protein product [Pedinophyceae sp. YPF-701]|nr:unnamed protein product [Pedinophyceae sp. YPF-701]